MEEGDEEEEDTGRRVAVGLVRWVASEVIPAAEDLVETLVVAEDLVAEDLVIRGKNCSPKNDGFNKNTDYVEMHEETSERVYNLF